MQIGILASPERKAAWTRLAGEKGTWTWVQDTKSAQDFDCFIDLDFDIYPKRILDYTGNTNTIFLLSAVNVTLELALKSNGIKYMGEKFYGINAIPTFLERETLEITNPFNLSNAIGEDFKWWGKMEWVASRIGMVTPRIVFMIINEAFYTLQEGTAEKTDIDIAMKLGTAYPKGPFEWCAEAGIDNVYNTLYAIFEDTGDERYKICPALKREWTQSHI